jgi:hypothetical protein
MRTCAAGFDVRMDVCVPKPVARWSFDEGAGSVAHDSSGAGHDGALVGGPMWVAGKIGPYALEFDGLRTSVLVGDPSDGSLDFETRSFSYGAWVFANASVGASDMAWSKGGAAPAQAGYDLELGTLDWNGVISDGQTVQRVNVGSETLNQWVHLMIVVDRDQHELRGYRGGAVVGTTSIGGFGSTSTDHLAVIGSDETSMNHFRGTLDEVMIFDRALTDEQARVVATP